MTDMRRIPPPPNYSDTLVAELDLELGTPSPPAPPRRKTAVALDEKPEIRVSRDGWGDLNLVICYGSQVAATVSMTPEMVDDLYYELKPHVRVY